MKKKDTLKEIIVKKTERIGLAKQQLLEEDLKLKAAGLLPCRPFLEAINRPKTISLIAEIKKASPSAGIIMENFNPAEIAKIYQEAGAQAVSILTEEDFFYGSPAYISEVRNTIELPVLRKDFILESYQIYESRFFGADAVLLIADLLSKEKLAEMIGLADSLGMDCLVEIHTEKELKKVLGLKVPSSYPDSVQNKKMAARPKGKKFVNFAVGINNRDLHSLETDFKTTERLYPLIPKDRTVVVESGIKTYQDALFLKILGVNAILVGESILKAEDKKAKIQDLMGW